MLMARPKGSKNKTRNTAKATRDHEIQLALIAAFARDPELKYFMGMGAGAGVAWIGKMMQQYDVALPMTEKQKEQAEQKDPDYQAKQTILSELKALPYTYLAFQFGGLTGLSLQQLYRLKDQHSVIAQKMDDASISGNSGGVFGAFGGILAMGGAGFASTCAMILILRAVFSGTDLGELMGGVGALIPFT